MSDTGNGDETGTPRASLLKQKDVPPTVALGDSTRSQVRKSLQQRPGLKSPLTRQFRSPLHQQFKSPLSKKSSTSRPEVSDEELKEQLSSLQSRIKAADQEIEELKAEGYMESELQTHIEKLHEYNEIKDVGQMVLGQIAVLEGVQTKDLYPRYGLDFQD